VIPIRSRFERALWTAILACSAWVTLAAAGGPVHFDAGKKSLAIPFTLNSGHVLLRGRVGKRDSATFVLDSGASSCAIDEGAARRMGLKVKAGGESHGAGGTVATGHIMGATLALPGLTVSDKGMTTLPLAGLSAASGVAIDGIIGRPLFESCVVRLDYEHGRMDVFDARHWKYSGGAEVLPLTFEEGVPYTTAQVTLPGRAPVTGRSHLDIGASTALILTPEFLAREHVTPSAGSTIEIVTGGIGGPRPADLGRIPRLSLGQVAFDSVVTVFRRPGPGSISAEGTQGNIGSGILSRFTVTFDYMHRIVILEPNGRFGDPFEHDKSGLGLRTRGASYDTVEVVWRLANSPASEAGVEVGDLVESVDGTPVNTIGLEAIRARLRRAGPVVIGVVHAGTRREVRMTARPLF